MELKYILRSIFLRFGGIRARRCALTGAPNVLIVLLSFATNRMEFEWFRASGVLWGNWELVAELVYNCSSRHSSLSLPCVRPIFKTWKPSIRGLPGSRAGCTGLTKTVTSPYTTRYITDFSILADWKALHYKFVLTTKALDKFWRVPDFGYA